MGENRPELGLDPFSPMFDWLLEEIAGVKTGKFHLVDGPLPTTTRVAMENANVRLPPSYQSFILRFGNAKLYRAGSIYLVRVFAVPRAEVSNSDENLLHFGRTDCSLAYFNDRLLVEGTESPVFEWRHKRGIQRAADSFEQWLSSECKAARRQFTADQWKSIRIGPLPYNSQEQAIIEVRRRFKWQVIGIAENGDLRFRVQNGSGMVLPYLSLGVRELGGEDIGNIWLPVASVLPGQTKTIEKGCYKEHHRPESIQVFQLSDPSPEERSLYWEFKNPDQI